MGSEQSLAVSTDRENRDRHVMIVFNGSAGRAADLPDVSVDLREFVRSGGSMKSIHILGDEPEFPGMPFQRDDGFVRWIGFLGSEQLAPPVVPFPYQPWVTLECLGRGEIFCEKVAPQPVRAPKGRHAAVR